MKNIENAKKNSVGYAKKFELDTNEMNQIVGGATFLLETNPMDDTGLFTSDTYTFGSDGVLACEQSCKSCTSIRVVINICKSKFKNK